ncbi:hypothetical protein [Actinomyces oricola]
MDPIDALLGQEQTRTTLARNLSAAQESMVQAIDTYKELWKQATRAGWAKRDLTRAGLIDPVRLPRIRHDANNAPKE